MLFLGIIVLANVVIMISLLMYNPDKQNTIYTLRKYLSLQADDKLIKRLTDFNKNQYRRDRAQCSNVYHIHIIGEMFKTNDLAKDIINRIYRHSSFCVIKNKMSILPKDKQILVIEPYMYTDADNNYTNRIKNVINHKWPSTTIIITRDPTEICHDADFLIINSHNDYDFIQYLQYVYDCSVTDAINKLRIIQGSMDSNNITLYTVSQYIKRMS